MSLRAAGRPSVVLTLIARPVYASLQSILEQGRVTVNVVTLATGSSRNTVKDHMKALRENGFITPHGAGRGTWYTLA